MITYFNFFYIFTHKLHQYLITTLIHWTQKTTTSRQLKEIQNKTRNDGVGDISSLFQRHCQTNTSFSCFFFLNIRNARCLFSEFVLFCITLDTGQYITIQYNTRQYIQKIIYNLYMYSRNSTTRLGTNYCSEFVQLFSSNNHSKTTYNFHQ